MISIDKDTNAIKIVAKDTAMFAIALDNYELQDGDKVYFTINDKLEDPEFRTQKEITAFLGGRAIISLSTHDTDLTPGTYYYDVQINLRDGSVDTVIGPAKFKVLGGVTY